MTNQKLFIYLMFLFFLPNIVFVTFKQTSLALGMMISLTCLNMYYLPLIYSLKFKLSMFFLFIFLFLYCSYFLLYYDSLKPLFSLLLLVLIFLSAYQFSAILLKIKIEVLTSNLVKFIFLIILCGWLKLVYIPEFLGYSHEKATFPFSEESHFALALGFLVLSYSFVGNIKYILFFWINMIILSLLYPSLTLLIFSILVICPLLLKLRKLAFTITVVLIIPLIIIVLIYSINTMDYFSSRLTFENTTNLTTLVWLQGVELAYLNFINTYGIGVGFQMLGNVSTITGNFTDLITPIIGGNGSLNLEDGGFLSAKLIAEFGVIGIAIVILYIIQIFKILFKIRKLNQKIELDDMEKKQLILYGFIFSFLVEMFLRGYGYFSPCLLIVLTAYFSLLRIEKIINKRRPLNCL